MNRFSKQEIKEIEDLYRTGKYTCKDLSLMYGRCESAVNQNFRYRKVKVFNDQTEIQRKYTVNKNYFDVIDTEAKAYFLGLLYSDGCNSEETNTVIINLQERDKHILDSFNMELGSNKPLRFIELNKKNHNWSNYYILTIHCKHFSEQLKRLGCVKAKSLILKFPGEDIVPNDLLRHFVRGYFDGDGCFCVYFQKSKLGAMVKKYYVGITSTDQFCQEVKRIMIPFGISVYIGAKKDAVARGNFITKDMKGSGPNAFRFLDWMYKGASFYLHRKHNKYVSERSLLLEKAKAGGRYAKYLTFLSEQNDHAYPERNNPTVVCPGPPI